MPAIPVHHTETSDRPWDGPANEARLKTDQDYSYYRRAYAWRDPDGDDTKKGSYKFIHHEVDSDGNPGPANIRACIAGIAALNGARTPPDIPDADRQGVYNHLAAHLWDADVEPPELKRNWGLALERRSFPFTEVRINGGEADSSPKIIGYAAVFNKLSEDLGGFRELIAPGAFKKTIQEADVRALVDHDPSRILGRTKSGTLGLSEDETGLLAEIEPPNTTVGRDILESLKRGDVSGMSFGFRTIKDRWKTNNGQNIRTLLEVALYDVSIVTYPAYPDTSVAMRSAFNAGINFEGNIPAEPGLAAHSANTGEDKALAGLAILRRRLEIAEKEI